MKSPSNDNRHRLLINGDELTELKRHASDMPESKGLDRRIESYKGIRPITFEHSELGSLVDLLDDALIDPDKYPDQTTSAYLALKKLRDRMHQEYIVQSAADEPTTALSLRSTATGKARKSTAASEPSAPLIIGYQLKITLHGSKPPIWRRILVGNCSLSDLHSHIQSAMGWWNYHLHCFQINKQVYTDVETFDGSNDDTYTDSAVVRLSDIIPEGETKFKFRYEYDFGDSWEHVILFEKRVGVESADALPACIAGAGACPPEDCGGIWGYSDILAAIQNKNHERHEEFRGWIGRSFDPEAFDAEVATRRMRSGRSPTV